MLKSKGTRKHAGVVICGTGADLEELYCALNTLMKKRDGLDDGEVPQSGTNLRISSLCYDLRHALPVPSKTVSERSDGSGAMKGPVGDAGRILSFETGKELPFDLSLDMSRDDGIEDPEEPEGLEELEELEELEGLEEFEGIEGFDEDYIDAGELDEAYENEGEVVEAEEVNGAQDAAVPGSIEYYETGEQTGLPLLAICEFRILWPELIFVCLLLRDYMGSRYDLAYSKKFKGLDWTLEWVTVRRFQIVVLDSLSLYTSPTQARSIRKVFLDSFSTMGGYCTHYVDKLSNTFAGKNAEQRLKLLPQLTRKIVAQGSDYRAIEAEIRSMAREYGCPPWELALTDEVPPDFDW